MAVDQPALERITAYLTASRNSAPARKEIIRVSSSGDCSRKIGYKLLGFPYEEPTVNELVTFEIGHSYHHMLQGWLVEMGWTTQELLEFPLADEATRSRGSCDAITVRLDKKGQPDPTGSRRVIEIKSITNVAQERYGKESAGAFTRLEKPRDYHLDQANMYAYLWNNMLERWWDGKIAGEPLEWEGRYLGRPEKAYDLVTHVTLIYVGKDTAHMPIKVFTQPISEKRIAKLKAKFARIWEHVDREALPPRDHNPFSQFPPCTYCPFHALCLSDGAEPHDSTWVADDE